MKPLKNIEFLIINLLKNMVISISNILAFVMLLSFSMAEISPQVYVTIFLYRDLVEAIIEIGLKQTCFMWKIIDLNLKLRSNRSLIISIQQELL